VKPIGYQRYPPIIDGGCQLGPLKKGGSRGVGGEGGQLLRRRPGGSLTLHRRGAMVCMAQEFS